MIEKLGPDCHNCHNFAAFHEELGEAESRCAVLAQQMEGDGITAIMTPASFICTAALGDGCNAEIIFPRLQLVLEAE